MTLDPKKPVQTRDGRKARIICLDRVGTEYPIVALVESRPGYEAVFCYPSSGKCGSCKDLVNIPVKTSKWRNIYVDPLRTITDHLSRESAEKTGCKQLKHGILRLDFEDDVLVNSELEPVK